MANEAKRADRILTHYIRLALESAGVTVTPDMLSQFDGLFQSVLNEAVEQIVPKAVYATLDAIKLIEEQGGET